MLAITFLAPSFSISFAIFISNSIVQVISYFLIWSKTVDFDNDPGLLDLIFFWYTSYFFFDLLYFVVLQKRELKQFFSYEELKKKQDQMTTIFDAQSDAVVIVGQDATQLEENQQQEYELVELKLPEFKFCNSKSIELFGVDL